jgi:hypothetical protein
LGSISGYGYRKGKVYGKKMALFHFVWVEIREDPGTAEATMEGLAFPDKKRYTYGMCTSLKQSSPLARSLSKGVLVRKN